MLEIYLCELCESSPGRISSYRINFYRAIRCNAQSTRIHKQKLHKFIKRSILTNSHKSFARIIMSPYGSRVAVCIQVKLQQNSTLLFLKANEVY